MTIHCLFFVYPSWSVARSVCLFVTHVRSTSLHPLLHSPDDVQLSGPSFTALAEACGTQMLLLLLTYCLLDLAWSDNDDEPLADSGLTCWLLSRLTYVSSTFAYRCT